MGLQAQLRDAEAHAGEAEADRAGVRAAGLQLVRDTVAVFQLTATEVFGDASISFTQQQVGAKCLWQKLLRSCRPCDDDVSETPALSLLYPSIHSFIHSFMRPISMCRPERPIGRRQTRSTTSRSAWCKMHRRCWRQKMTSVR